MRLGLILLAASVLAAGAERTVDPTFLHRSVAAAAPAKSDLDGPGVHYRPLFDAGADANVLKALARFADLTIDSGGATATVARANEEQAFVVLSGAATLRYGEDEQALRAHDFFYVPAGTRHALVNRSTAPVRLVVMGFRLRGDAGAPPPKLLIANIDAIKKQVVGNHPPTTLYQLMMGDRKSTRDAIAAGRVLTSLYVMEFAPGGTNFPHHHPTEEEAYLVLDGEGDMVAGGGTDGVEGRHPVKAGDAYFFRLNCTVGFYNSPGNGKAHILALRWLYPFPERRD